MLSILDFHESTAIIWLSQNRSLMFLDFFEINVGDIVHKVIESTMIYSWKAGQYSILKSAMELK